MSKSVVIFGDSYSTYEGCIPEGYACYYTSKGRAENHVTKMKKEETWWMRLLNKTGWNLLLNNSWSGSTVCHTGWNGVDCSHINSFIYRFRQLRDNGFFKENKVDTVLVFGGTNDSWSNAPLGEIKLADFEEKDLYNVLPAFGYLMSEMKSALPEADIYFLVNSDLKPEVGECIEKAGKHFGVNVIKLHDIDKREGHPTPLGMETICEQVFANLK